MADVAFGIVGVVSLAIQLGQILDRLRREFTELPDDLKVFAAEIAHHRANLDRAQALLKTSAISPGIMAAGAAASTSPFSSSLSADDWVEPCRIELAKVVDELSMPKQSLHRRWDRIKKTLRADSLRSSMERLHRFCDQVSQQVGVETLGTAQQTLGVAQTIQARVDDAQELQRQKAVLTWLSRVLHTRRHQDLLAMWHAGTVDWVFEQDAFINWFSGSQVADAEASTVQCAPTLATPSQTAPVSPIIWYHGGPGVGKSVMTARVVHELTVQRPLQVAVVYLYCDYKDRANQDLLSLLASLVRQMTEQAIELTGRLPAQVDEAYRHYSEGVSGRITLADAEKLLIGLFGLFRRSFILIDGLDEFVNSASASGITPTPKPAEILQRIYSLYERCPPNSLRLFITSRDHMLLLHPKVSAVRVAMTAAASDIRSFVQGYMATESFCLAEEVQARSGLHEEITRRIMEKASGQFLLASMTIRDLGDEDNIRDLKEALECLPVDHIERYKEALERINSQLQKKKAKATGGTTEALGMQVLALIFHARAPLTVSQVQHALAARKGDATFDRDGIHKPEVITSSGVGLVRINNQEQVEFVHNSVGEFLGSQELYVERLARLEESLVQRCMTYMSFNGFAVPCEDREKRAQDFPFLEYAVRNFGSHAGSCVQHNPSLLPEYLHFLQGDIQLGVWQVYAAKVLVDPAPDHISAWRSALGDLHLSIVVGFVEATKYLLEHGDVDINEKGYEMETPLHMAACAQNVAAAELLLAHGADVHQTNYSGRNALDIVMHEPFMRVMSKILDHLLVAKRKTLPMQNLLLAIVNCQMAYLKDLRDRTAMAQVLTGMQQIKDNKPAVQCTSLSRKIVVAFLVGNLAINLSDAQTKLVQMLIEAGADLNACGAAIITPLQLAASYQRQDLVAQMLEKGANPWVDHEMGYTTLQMAQAHRDTDGTIAQLIADRMEQILQRENAEPDPEKKRRIPGPCQAQFITGQVQGRERARVLAHGEPVEAAQVGFWYGISRCLGTLRGIMELIQATLDMEAILRPVVGPMQPAHLQLVVQMAQAVKQLQEFAVLPNVLWCEGGEGRQETLG